MHMLAPSCAPGHELKTHTSHHFLTMHIPQETRSSKAGEGTSECYRAVSTIDAMSLHLREP